MDNTLFSTAVMLIDKIMVKVLDVNLHQPTPCSEWDVEKLANHMLNELAWVAPLIEGKTIAEVGDQYDGDLMLGNAGEAWMKYCQEASTAMAKSDPNGIAHLSYGDKSNQAYVDEVAADLIVHGWDLAQALGEPYTVDDKTIELLTVAIKDIMPMAKEYGVVGPEPPVSEGSSKMDKLLGYFGRSSNWKKA